MSIAANYRKITDGLPEGVTLVAVTKTHGPAGIMALYNCGHRIMGENKVQELLPKQEALPRDIQWHLVGHLQSNKVKYIAPFVSMIHSVDSLKLLRVIDKEARKNDRVIPCLLQIHIAEEDTKFGLSFEEACSLLESPGYRDLDHVAVAGLMGMATFTEDENQVRQEFRRLKAYFDRIRGTYFDGKPEFRHLSMGMSDDYPVAIEEGSTMIRIGTALFGDREQA
jgi:hypothetical protein